MAITPKTHHVSIRQIPHYPGYACLRVEDQDKPYIDAAPLALVPFPLALDHAASISRGQLAIVDYRRTQ